MIIRFPRVSTATTDIIIKSTVKIASDGNSGVAGVGVEVPLVDEDEVAAGVVIGVGVLVVWSGAKIADMSC